MIQPCYVLEERMKNHNPTPGKRKVFRSMCHGSPFAGWTMASLQCALGVCVLVLLGCGAKSGFKPLRLDAAPDQYRSATWTRQSTVSVDKLSAGLRCVVEASSNPKATPYGGIMLPGCAAKGWRLEMAFTDPDAILAAYVDGYNAEKKRVVRWQTSWGAKLRADRATYVFMPQESTQGFKPVTSEGSGPVETIHVFVRLKPRSGASFELYGVELAK
jgi:hypothetical protein